MKSALLKSPAFFVIPALFVFIAVALFGMSHAFGMEMREDGTMGGCPFDGKAEICRMTFFEHLSQWQGMLTATVEKAELLIALLVLISTFGALLFLRLMGRLLLLLCNFNSDQGRVYFKQNLHTSLFNYLQEAFSQGILHSRVYA